MSKRHFQFAETLAIITLDTGEVSPLIPVGAQPERLALSPDGKRAYVANLGGGSISVIDLTLGEVITTIPLGNLPFNVLITPNGELIYVGFVMDKKIVMIDTHTNTVVGDRADIKAADRNTCSGIYPYDLGQIDRSNYMANAEKDNRLRRHLMPFEGDRPLRYCKTIPLFHWMPPSYA